MKKLSLLSVLVVCLFLVANVASAAGIRKEFKAYEITAVEDLVFGKNIQAVWTLNYNNSENPISVVKRKTSEGAEYVVGSKHFEVSYAATSSGFGAKMVRKSWSTVPKPINNAVINRNEMKKQTVISSGKIDDETALGLIASYLPDLINDGYTHVLN